MKISCIRLRTDTRTVSPRLQMEYTLTRVCLRALGLDHTDWEWEQRAIDCCGPHLCNIDEGREAAMSTPGTSLQVLSTYIYPTVRLNLPPSSFFFFTYILFSHLSSPCIPLLSSPLLFVSWWKKTKRNGRLPGDLLLVTWHWLPWWLPINSQQALTCPQDAVVAHAAEKTTNVRAAACVSVCACGCLGGGLNV